VVSNGVHSASWVQLRSYGRKSSGSSLESREYGRKDPSRWPLGTVYPLKLALTSLTSGGHGIFRSKTKAAHFFSASHCIPLLWIQIISFALSVNPQLRTQYSGYHSGDCNKCCNLGCASDFHLQVRTVDMANNKKTVCLQSTVSASTCRVFDWLAAWNKRNLADIRWCFRWIPYFLFQKYRLSRGSKQSKKKRRKVREILLTIYILMLKRRRNTKASKYFLVEFYGPLVATPCL
jgi:hypothetical protein